MLKEKSSLSDLVKKYFIWTTEKNLFVILNLILIILSILCVGIIPTLYNWNQFTNYFSLIMFVVSMAVIFLLIRYDIRFSKNRKKVLKWIKNIGDCRCLLFCEKVTLTGNIDAYKLSKIKNNEKADIKKLKQKFLAGNLGAGIISTETERILRKIQSEELSNHLQKLTDKKDEIIRFISDLAQL